MKEPHPRARRDAEGPRPVSDEIVDEIEHHLELRARELEKAGLPAAEARAEARRRFGDVARVRDECTDIQQRRRRRAVRREGMSGWSRDLRHALRGLVRTPVVTGAALLTLALGIGANTAVFSVVRGVLLSPLPFHEPHELVLLNETRAQRGLISVSPANYLDWRARARSFDGMAAYNVRSVTLLGGDEPIRLQAGVVSGNFFTTLGVDAETGGTFDPTLSTDGSLRRAVLGHGLWTSRYGSDPSVVGRTVRLDDEVYDVVGVAPRSFDFPEGVALWVRSPTEAPDIPGLSGDVTQMRSAWYFDVVARLADGVALAAAQSELDAVAAALREAYPDDNEDAGIAATPLHEVVVAGSRPLLLLLLGAVALVLLAATANVANLGLVRAEGRRRDFAVRAAMGADGGRLLRFVALEGLLLAVAGGALGTALAVSALPVLVSVLPADLPRRTAIGLDGWVLAFTVAVSLAACVLFALAPALMARRVAPASALAGRGGDGGGRSGSWLRGALVVTEVALGVVLAAGTGLVVRSVAAMATVESGFRADGLATLSVSFPEGVQMTDEARRERWRRLVSAVESAPGVSAAGAGIASPTARGPQAGLRVVGRDMTAIADASVVWHPASSDYLEALGVPLLRGRAFGPDDRDGATHVALVTELLATRFFPGTDPIGQRVTIGLDQGHQVEIEIVGIVGDTRNRGPLQEPTPILYRPLAQAGGFGGGTMVVAARGAVDGGALLRATSRAVRDTDPTAVVYGEALGEELGQGYFARHTFVLTLLGLFAVLAVGLAAVGIYGVTAHAVGRRRRELGIRMAMGATRARVWSSVLAGGLRLTGIGIAVGVALAALGGRALSGLLFRVGPVDPLTLAAVALVLTTVAAAALALPAAQAVRVDPADSMRAE